MREAYELLSGGLLTCVEQGAGGRCVRYLPTCLEQGAKCLTESPAHPTKTGRKRKKRARAPSRKIAGKKRMAPSRKIAGKEGATLGSAFWFGGAPVMRGGGFRVNH